MDSEGIHKLRGLLAGAARLRARAQERMRRHAMGFMECLPELPGELARQSEEDAAIAEAMRLGAQGLRFLGLAGDREAEVCAEAIGRIGRDGDGGHGQPEDGSWSFGCRAFDPELRWAQVLGGEDSAGFALREAAMGGAGPELALALAELAPLDPEGRRRAAWRLSVKVPLSSSLGEGEVGRAAADLADGLDEWLDGRFGWALPDGVGPASSMMELSVRGAPAMRLRGFGCICPGRDLGADGVAEREALRRWVATSSPAQARAAKAACGRWGLELAAREIDGAPGPGAPWL